MVVYRPISSIISVSSSSSSSSSSGGGGTSSISSNFTAILFCLHSQLNRKFTVTNGLLKIGNYFTGLSKGGLTFWATVYSTLSLRNWPLLQRLHLSAMF